MNEGTNRAILSSTHPILDCINYQFGYLPQATLRKLLDRLSLIEEQLHEHKNSPSIRLSCIQEERRRSIVEECRRSCSLPCSISRWGWTIAKNRISTSNATRKHQQLSSFSKKKKRGQKEAPAVVKFQPPPPNSHTLLSGVIVQPYQETFEYLQLLPELDRQAGHDYWRGIRFRCSSMNDSRGLTG
jgi:hypothetical protein